MGNMFSLLYCFIGSFFIFTCALASNETRNGNKSSINDCIHLTDKAQISRLGELFESKLVNIVDLRFSVDSDFNETLFHRMQLTLVNMVGLKITLWLDSYPLSHNKDFTWTLNAGRRSFELHANTSHEGCVGRNLSSMDFVDSLLQELQGSSKLTTHEICYRKHVNSTQRCCKSINYPSETRCHEIREFLKSLNLDFILLGTILSFMFTLWLTMVIYSSSAQRERQKYFEYYKLTESPMSLSSVISIVIWEEFGGYIGSIARKCTLLSILLWLLYWMWSNAIADIIITSGARVLTIFFFVFLFLAVPVKYILFTNFLNIRGSIEIAEMREIFPKLCNPQINFPNKLANHLEYDIRDMNWVCGTTFDKTIKIISLALNIKQWKVSIVKFYFRNRRYCNNLYKKYAFHIIIPFIYFLYICIVLISLLILLLLIIFPARTGVRVVVVATMCYTPYTISSLFFLYRVVPPIFMGILFNIVYFIPYIALFAVMAFYSFNFWKPYEEKYFALKKMIYEECRDHAYKEKHLETIRRQKGRDTKLVPVVSRKLYHKIRERLLPYHKSFFYYSLTVATLIIPLSTILYGELETLREIDVTPAISFLITLMIGALPYAYNLIIQARNGEDWRAAWKEEIKMNVKCMVQDNQDLAKTILVIRPDGTADDDGENDGDNGDDDESNSNDEQPEQEMVQDGTLDETAV